MTPKPVPSPDSSLPLWKRWLVPTLVSAALAVVGLASWFYLAADGDRIQTYTIQHADSQEVGARLQQLFNLQHLTAQVLVDAKAHRLLVNGPTKAQRSARQLLHSLDQPLEVLEAQREPRRFSEQEVSTAPHHATPDLKATPRSGEEAPIRRANIETPLVRSNTAVRRASAEDATEQTQRTILLRQIAMNDLQRSLQSLMGRGPVEDPTTHELVFVLENKKGNRTEVTLDRRGNRVVLSGDLALVDAWARVITVLDQETSDRHRGARIVPLQRPNQEATKKALVAFQQTAAAEGEDKTKTPAKTEPGKAEPGKENAAGEENGGFIGPVQIEFVEGLDVIVIRGNPKDVSRVTEIVNEIEKLSGESEQAIEIVPLRFAGSEAAAALLTQLYEQVLSVRQGRISISALAKPNAILLVGRPNGVKSAMEILQKIDQPVDPATQFQIFPLQNANAATLVTTIREFFANRQGLGPKVVVSADPRANALIVQAGPRDLDEVAALVKRLDVAGTDSVNDLRVFPLQHSLAEELVPVLQSILLGQKPQSQQQNMPYWMYFGSQSTQSSTNTGRTAALQMEAGAEGDRIRSGILNEVKITADGRANSVIVSAPHESMELIATLIKQLDQLPTADLQIKVFTIENGDATRMAQMLETLFTKSSTTQQYGVPGGAAAAGEATIVPLKFSVDQRTNSIVASGSASDLAVVEGILLRLDDGNVRQRSTTVYRLKNAPAPVVAQSINELLRSERQLQTLGQGLVSPFEQIEKEVVVVPEEVSNSLIVSATPRYFEEIKKVVEKLDARPPMVMIQVLIAEVDLNNTDEFGIELGLQDSVLFDRSLLGNLQTVTTTTSQGNPAVTTQTQNVVAATNTPGFNFNNTDLGNSGSTKALAQSHTVGSQGLSHFGVGRVNNELGFGGLVLSASSDSVSALLRALQEKRRTDVLARPQVMTLDNQPAYIQVGQRVPFITGSSSNQFGLTNSTTLIETGIILQVRPRISQDGLVVMEVDAEKSEVGPESAGIPIQVTNAGQIVRSPRIDRSTAQTTVSAIDGQTIVLGGLISKQINAVHRRVPLLADVPLLGNLFRYDNVNARKTELIIILTPHIVRSQREADILKQTETARISWCLSDVCQMDSASGLRSRCGDFSDDGAVTVFPDMNQNGEIIPALPPQSPTPAGPEEVPSPGALPKLEEAPAGRLDEGASQDSSRLRGMKVASKPKKKVAAK